ncbi:hypothetical protein [Nocardioides sp. NPDC000441]|uniref:hypothetical protein n=1 Tax=Nocardioides sp. NPDC000441 TaxID=3154256 RepID=UPI003324A798
MDFEIAKGEMFVVMGLSGSGKSTVLTPRRRCRRRCTEPEPALSRAPRRPSPRCRRAGCRGALRWGRRSG